MISNIRQVIRGNQVRFRANFFNFDKQILRPNTATVAVNYMANGAPANTSLQMVFDPSSNSYLVIWSTRGVDPGPVSYHIYQDQLGEAATDGELIIVGNDSNQGQ